MDTPARGRLLGLRVVVFNEEDAKRLFSKFFGRPFGSRKASPEGPAAPLELSLAEALYLQEKGLLEVVDEEGRLVEPAVLASRGRKHVPKFDTLYRVMKELRDAGYVVRSGLKYGADFAVYEKGPGLEHAPYLVHVVEAGSAFDPLEIIRAGRLSHSVRKAFIMALVGPEGTETKYIVFKWSKP